MGPLDDLKVVEMAGIGPAPLCAMMLADQGADVVRIDMPPGIAPPPRIAPRNALHNRGRRSVALNLKTEEGKETLLRLVEEADALIEGFRPGVMERLGLGPEDCHARNPRLVYGRMTGWGQTGPLAMAAGHDLNYIALTGALHSIGTKERPVVPLNLIGDFGGGGMVLAFGVVAALLEARRSGKGQVIDAAMVDGTAALMGSTFGRRADGQMNDNRASNQIDGGAPYYNVYETRDGKFVTVGSIEPQFYALLLEKLGLAGDDLPPQEDRAHWPEMQGRFARLFKEKTRDEWCALLEGTDICFAPVLDMGEAPHHAHLKARGTYVELDGQVQPAPAPRFSRTPGAIQGPPPEPGEHTQAALADWGFSAMEIEGLKASGALG